MQQAITFSRLQRCLKRFQLAALLRIAYPNKPYKPKKNFLIYWRAHILFTMLCTSLVLGVFAFTAAMTLVVRDGICGLALVDIVVYILAAYLFFSKHRRYEFRSIGTLTIGYITGVAIIFFLGPLEIKRAGMRAAGIVSQLLNYSRKTDISIMPLDAVQVIEATVDFLRSTIPATIVDNDCVAADAVTCGAPEGRASLLFVDDEEAIVAMSQKGLERLGYAVTTRTSPVKALELFQADPGAFDLVVGYDHAADDGLGTG